MERRPDYGFPAWELVEVISFGRFIHFYKFCADKFDDRRMRNDFYMLQSVKGFRNGCAHNNCIINDLRAGTPPYAPRNDVKSALGLGQRRREGACTQARALVEELAESSKENGSKESRF